MSKKHKRVFQESGSRPEASLSHTAEYHIIKHDLIKVLVLNIIYLAAILAIYYTDLKSHYLEHWFDKLLHF
jgi:hypothetical protein